MHIERNVFDNIFNTVLNIFDKIKDTKKSRDELNMSCNHPKLAKKAYGTYENAAHCINDKAQKKKLFDWIKQLKFLDGYAYNM